MSTESEIDVRIQHRNWLARLFGKDEFRLEIDLPHNMVAAADAKTVQGAWNGAVLSAKWFAGVKIISECPFDAAGNPLQIEEQPEEPEALGGSNEAR